MTSRQELLKASFKACLESKDYNDFLGLLKTKLGEPVFLTEIQDAYVHMIQGKCDFGIFENVVRLPQEDNELLVLNPLEILDEIEVSVPDPSTVKKMTLFLEVNVPTDLIETLEFMEGKRAFGNFTEAEQILVPLQEVQTNKMDVSMIPRQGYSRLLLQTEMTKKATSVIVTSLALEYNLFRNKSYEKIRNFYPEPKDPFWKKHVQKHRTVAFVGPVGCGKTTIAESFAKSFDNVFSVDENTPDDLKVPEGTCVIFDGNPQNKHLKEMIFTARHQKVTIVVCCENVKEMSADVRANMDSIFMMDENGWKRET